MTRVTGVEHGIKSPAGWRTSARGCATGSSGNIPLVLAKATIALLEADQ